MSDVSNYGQVGAFHIKFNLPNALRGGVDPRALPADVAQFRLNFMLEELLEYAEACNFVVGFNTNTGKFEFNQPGINAQSAPVDLPKAADALIDLVYVALGTAHLMGLPWQELFDEVQRANMTKERATGADDARSTRPHSLNVVKPEGWTPPNIPAVLRRFGWKCDGNHGGPPCGEGCWNDDVTWPKVKADGISHVIHDDNLTCTTPGVHPISECNFVEKPKV